MEQAIFISWRLVSPPAPPQGGSAVPAWAPVACCNLGKNVYCLSPDQPLPPLPYLLRKYTGSAGRLKAASEQPNLELRSNLRSHESVVERIFSKSNFTKPSISLNTVESFQFVSALLRQFKPTHFATEHLCTTFCICTTFIGSTS